MSFEKRDLPLSMISPETGRVLVRGVRASLVEYRGESMVVDLPGYYPEDGSDDDDGVLVGDDMRPSDEALRVLKRRVHGDPIRKMRKRLRLSQREAGLLFKVGETAFDEYERGLVEPSGPTVQLLKLLDRHPELLEELR